MKLLASFVILCAVLYTLLVISMFVFQRNLLYYPVPYQPGVGAQEIQVKSDGLILSGWVLNPGRSRAIIYFGGNSEAIENNIANFEADFSDHSVYLIHYRGYGKSEGKPTEDGLYADALAIYDAIQDEHESINAMGRSLGSGVAVYLAAHREIDRLVLLTPYDSIVKVAQFHYPFIPAHYVARDRFEAFRYAPAISAPVLMITAELDRIVPVERALQLREYFSPGQVTYKMIPSAAHNDISEFKPYRELLKNFVARPG